MHGIPVFRGTRIPVHTLFGYIRERRVFGRELAMQVLEECEEIRLAQV
jgi:uncharacterized protein (DUF433 family)